MHCHFQPIQARHREPGHFRRYRSFAPAEGQEPNNGGRLVHACFCDEFFRWRSQPGEVFLEVLRYSKASKQHLGHSWGIRFREFLVVGIV